jgi:hypothetical protein
MPAASCTHTRDPRNSHLAPRNFVEARTSALLVACALSGSGWGAPTIQGDSERVSPAPRAALSTAGVYHVSLPTFEEAHGAPALYWSGVPIAPGKLIDLDLQRVEVFAPDAQIVVATGGGSWSAAATPPVVMFSGLAVGLDGRVFLAIAPTSANGMIVTGDTTYIISSGPAGSGLPPVIYDAGGIPEGLIQWRDFVCGTDQLTQGARPMAPGQAGPTDAVPCRVARVAIETDWQFTGTLFDGDTSASAAYAATLIGAVSEIYVKEVNTHFEISFLRVWGDPNDLWNKPDAIDQLFQFRDYWNEQMTDVSRSAAHFLSGRKLDSAGGVAYLAALCHKEEGYDYALSAHLNGYFPYPLQDHSDQNWDIMVVAHELGHNFGAPHTHSVDPPIDKCGLGDCGDKALGTIMSYCHICEGGLANVALSLHPIIINDYILPYLAHDAPCDLVPSPVIIVTPPTGATICVGSTLTLSVTATGGGALTYEWRKGGVPIPGATQPVYQVAAAGVADAGSYDVVVSGPCSSATSAAAVVQVKSPLLADLDGDCAVDQVDLGILLSCYDVSDCADLNGDGVTNQQDLGLLLSQYGK